MEPHRAEAGRSWLGAADRRASAREFILLGAILGFALWLRVAYAVQKGLVLDEFHTLFHATRPDARQFFATLLQDNHPPLGFLVVRAARALAGDGELALRAMGILCGLAEMACVWVVARRAFGLLVACLAVFLIAVSSLHLDLSTQARMYALLALSVTVASALFFDTLARGSTRGRRGAATAFAISCVALLHAHYFGLQYALVLGTLALGWLASRRARIDPARPWLVAALVTALAAAPWYLIGFRHQLTHGLPPGGHAIGLAALGESLVHLFFLDVRMAGVLRPLMIGAACVILLLAALGAIELLGREGRDRVLGSWLAASAFGVPLFATSLASLWPRAGFNWHYVLPSVAPMALLAARGACGTPWRGARLAALGSALVAATWLSLLHLRSTGSEDYPGAVRSILAAWHPGDAIVAAEWQPSFFSQSAPWEYYAPRLSGPSGPPPRLVVGQDFDLVDPHALEDVDRVLLLDTSLGPRSTLLRRLREDFPSEAVTNFGYGISVRRFERPRQAR